MRGEEIQKEGIEMREGWEEEEVGVMACPVVARAVDGRVGEEREVVKMGGEMPDSEVLTVRGIADLNGELVDSFFPSLPSFFFSPSSFASSPRSSHRLTSLSSPTSSFPNPRSLAGPETPVEVVDVANQSSSKLVPGTNLPWTLGAWASYYDTPADKKPGTFNIISYEITGTPLAKMVKPPRIVR